ncbi:membrane-associated, eicosanoid/glutathione metabolism protein [Aspergillus pseudodeflectus]|uniref:Membrane-associated, eicosanoid/glutathione metabolism protein n=1 Tax=Aspergillus pseudodeflectus TaxID=176178 RepID=A0ABR4JNE0_9EURO
MSTTHIPPLLQPIIALNGWTFAMEIWMYATRIPVFTRLKVAADNTRTRADIDRLTPAPVRWKADNYNNLFEQPTQFYAIALVLAIARRAAGEADNSLDVKLAWVYVGLRIVHSLTQATTNNIMRRFSLYIASSGVVAALGVRAAMLVF